ncbi:hypothetical protein EAS64_17545 [Trebonia kvetii]|uniref:Uncharacterized protein n=1 Tax=Trebonia kvetii TaxID=2480626 RepID=A0A6P2BZS9_9ACTN|nr:hypothetical protein [Trebonia kvetii]TVZ04197.1 hypothetical protein EAS64_17545 [Trebonia kvetii]
MQVVFWVVTAVGFALAEVCTVLAWFVAGVVLRGCQSLMIDARLFKFMRRFGLTDAATGLSQMRKIAHRNPRMILAIWGEAGFVILTALAMTATALWVSVGALSALTPPGLLPDGWETRTAVTAGILILASAGWFYLRGIGYAITSESRGRGSLPRVVVPGLTPAARRELALNIYFHAALQRGAILAAVLPTILTGVADKGPSPVPAPGWASWLIVLLSVAFMAPVVYVFHRLWSSTASPTRSAGSWTPSLRRTPEAPARPCSSSRTRCASRDRPLYA